MSLLRVRDVRAGYRGNEVLHGVSLDVAEKEFVSVVGPNGAGKSTTLMMLAGVLPTRGGSIVFDGADIAALTPERIAKRGIITVPERQHCFRTLSVRDNLRVGQSTARKRGLSAAPIDTVLDRFPDLVKRVGALAGTLSGGEQQQLAVARALLARPRLLVLDEPSLGLAPQITSKLFDVLRTLPGEGIAVLLVEQQARRAVQLSDRSYMLRGGLAYLLKDRGQELSDEQLREAYLGGADD